MKCVILQPSYIPWRGYFHLIQLADVFVFYDDVQYDKHGWRNRNRIKTHQGPHWLTIPVHSAGAPVDGTPIQNIQIDWKQRWNIKHWSTLQQSYRKAPFFSSFAPLLEAFFQRKDERLADFTIDLTIALARAMNITHTRFIRSSELGIQGSRTGRLIAICQHLGADQYISGPSARAYIDEYLFQQSGLSLAFMNYDYPSYPQLYPPYDPRLSILDLLFMTGPDAARFFKVENTI